MKKEELMVRVLTEKDQPIVADFIESEDDKIFGCLDFDADMVDSDDDIETEDGFYFGLFKNGELIGLATLGQDEDRPPRDGRYEHHILSNVYVKDAEREKGYGSFLVKEMIRISEKAYPYGDIYLDLLDSSLDKWYAKFGFEISGTYSGLTYEMRKPSKKKTEKNFERLTVKIEDHYIERPERLSNGKIVGTKTCLKKLGEIEDLEERLQKYTTIDVISALKGLLSQYEDI